MRTSGSTLAPKRTWPFSMRLPTPQVFVLALLFALTSCRKSEPAPAPPPVLPRTTTVLDLEKFSATPIGATFEGKPWISHVTVVDLDRDGRADVLACDDKFQA